MNMTEKALKVLKRNSNGFVLVVEGGMIDQAHHRGYAHRALSEAAAMDDAVKRTLDIMKYDFKYIPLFVPNASMQLFCF